MAIFQDDNVKVHQAQTVKEWLGEWHEESFSHKILTINGLLDGNIITTFISIERCINFRSNLGTQFMCENDSSCSLTSILSQFETDEP